MSRIGTQYKPLKYTIIAVYGWHVQVVVIKYNEKSPSLVDNEGFSVISGATTIYNSNCCNVVSTLSCVIPIYLNVMLGEL